MSYVFGNPGATKGCFRVVHVDTSGSRGAQLVLPDGGELPGGLADPYMVTRVDIGLQEDRFISKNIGDVNFLYAFGHNAAASQATVTLLAIMFGNYEGQGQSNPVPDLIQMYTANRVWEQEEQALLLMEGSVVASGFIDALTSSTQDAQSNLQAISFRFVIPTIRRGLPNLAQSGAGTQGMIDSGGTFA